LLTKNQRLFSIFETFTDGRVTRKVLVRGLPGTWPRWSRRHLPLYRSFLEIEFRRPRAAGEPWHFCFTAHAVTGTATTDNTGDPDMRPSAPVVADAFVVKWHPDTGVEVCTSAWPASLPVPP
jgi:hypothetical protein